ncbi:hypothetical protein PybrP1_003581 [[Pythium] brassicae (nom. inval.)]|nr:hypothetical protein PybrP1_003581 [[Pythium] brassicae (nom. inval.)]
MDIADLFSPPAAPLLFPHSEAPPSLDATTTSSEAGDSEPQPAALDAMTREAEPEDPAEVRRKRNRESMRRVRLRKRNAKINTQHMVDELESRLKLLMERNARAARALAAREQQDPTATLALARAGGRSSSSAAPTYTELLSETTALSYANKGLRDRIKQHQVVEAALARMAGDERLQQQAQVASEALSDDADVVRPLLVWLTPAHLAHMVALATAQIRANKALVESLVLAPNNALGWSDQRCVEGQMARYLLRKSFRHESAERLAAKTWATIVDIDKLAQVMRWAKGMKILHWLSDDAAVVTRELAIPSPLGPDANTQFRFTLLVFRTRTPDGGYCLGTINLNIFGATVAECLAKTTSYMGGAHAHTMYGWTFSPVRDRASGDVVGCDVELAGLTGNGTLTYARNVLMEMVTVVLLWEHAFVASIRLLRT